MARGIVMADGQERRARVVLANADPFRLRELAGAHSFPADFNARLDSMRRDGTTMKVRAVAVREGSGRRCCCCWGQQSCSGRSLEGLAAPTSPHMCLPACLS